MDAVNAERRQSDASGSAAGSERSRAEQRLDDLFGTGHTLAVYGTLAPGRPNHHVLAPLGGEWTDGLIEGDLFPVGWGADLGYPEFRPRVGGDAVAVRVLTAPSLATAWADLDRFEGPGYELCAGVRHRARPRAGGRTASAHGRQPLFPDRGRSRCRSVLTFGCS